MPTPIEILNNSLHQGRHRIFSRRLPRIGILHPWWCWHIHYQSLAWRFGTNHCRPRLVKSVRDRRFSTNLPGSCRRVQ